MGRSLATGVVLGCLALAGRASAQMAISARSGLINYIEGTVLLDGAAVTIKPGSFPQMENGSELRTEEGRAEVLLAPGVFMRLGENTAVRLLSGEIMDTRVEVLDGAVIVETADMAKDQALTFFLNGAMLGLVSKGLYRLDGEPPQISVYEGEAWVTTAWGQAQILKRGRRLRLDGAVAGKFDTKVGDDLFRWARRRSEYLAVANVSATMAAQPSGYVGGSGWTWNPFFGTYTFLPAWGLYNNFWGCQFYAPYWGDRPTRPGQGPIHFGPRPPRPPGHPGRPPVASVTGGRSAWGARPAGPNHSSGSTYARGVPSGGGSSHSSGGGYSGGGGGGGGHSSGGGSSGGGSANSGGGHSR